MIASGKLRHKVTRERYVLSDPPQNSIGEQTGTWTEVGEHRVEVSPVTQRTREEYLSNQERSLISHQVTMRYAAGVDSKQRLLFNDRILSIESVIDKGERHRELLLLCIENLNEG